MSKRETFDRLGKCPICRKQFSSEACPHTYREAEEVVRLRNASKDAGQIKPTPRGEKA